VRPTVAKEKFLLALGFAAGEKTIALLPGSRKSEIEQILPIMLKASLLIRQSLKNANFVIAKSPSVDWDIYNRQIQGYNLELKIIEGKTYDCLNICDFALVASGTAILETAIMEKPLAVIYKMGLLNYLLYRPQVKVPYIGIVNIVAGRLIVPEFIQFGATPKKIADYAIETIANPQKLNALRQDLSSVKNSLGETGAASRAAGIINQYLVRS
jgi:lipid-A-disaccharide synthase